MWFFPSSKNTDVRDYLKSSEMTWLRRLFAIVRETSRDLFRSSDIIWRRRDTFKSLEMFLSFLRVFTPEIVWYIQGLLNDFRYILLWRLFGDFLKVSRRLDGYYLFSERCIVPLPDTDLQEMGLQCTNRHKWVTSG